MPNVSNNRDKVRISILDAFKEAKYPGDANLVKGFTPIEQSSQEESEQSQVFAEFVGKRWQELSQEVLIQKSWTLSFLTTDAYHYYFPAFLLAILNNHEAMSDLESVILMDLTCDGTDDSRFRVRFEQFTAQEKSAIREFLRFLQLEFFNGLPVGQAAYALEKYWDLAHHETKDK